MSGVLGVQLLRSPERFNEADGDRFAVRAWECDDTEQADEVADWLVDRVAGFWLTNISSYVLNTTGFSRRTDIKDDAFLCSRLSSIVDELGLIDQNPIEQARVLSRLFNRVLSMGESVLGLERNPAERSLPIAIRRRFFRPVRTSSLSPAVKGALAEVVQAATFSGTGPRRESRPFVLRHNRAHYASRLMRVPVPYGEWTEIAPPQDPSQAVQWAKNLLEARPLLINCEVTFRGPRAHDLALLANMGSGAAAVKAPNGPRANTRSWVAGPEFLVLVHLADVKIRGVLAADRYVPNPWAGFSASSEVGPNGGHELLCGPLVLRGRSALDYATGLVAESCAFALTASETPDPIGAWIASHDRAAMLTTCSELLHGFPGDAFRIAGFTRGRLWLRVPSADIDVEEVLARVAEVCEAGRLVPPLMPKPSGPACARRIEIGRRFSSEINARMDLELMPAVAAILGSRTIALGV